MQDAIQQTKTTLKPNTFEITWVPGKRLIISAQTYSWRRQNNQELPVLQQFELCAAAVLSKFFYKWKSSPRFFGNPPSLTLYTYFPQKSNNSINCFSFEVLPQVNILDFVTVKQQQGPYLQQLHIRSSLFMYNGACRLFWGRMTGRLFYGCSHMMFLHSLRDTQSNG